MIWTVKSPSIRPRWSDSRRNTRLNTSRESSSCRKAFSIRSPTNSVLRKNRRRSSVAKTPSSSSFGKTAITRLRATSKASGLRRFKWHAKSRSSIRCLWQTNKEEKQRRRHQDAVQDLLEAEEMRKRLVQENLKFHSYAERCVNEWQNNVS